VDVDGDDEIEGDGECDGDDEVEDVGDGDGDGDGNNDSDTNAGGDDDGEEGEDCVSGGIVPAGIVSTTKDFETTIANVKVVSAPTTIRRHINLRRCFIDALVFSSITRDASIHLSLPGVRLINSVPSARQNANDSSA